MSGVRKRGSHPCRPIRHLGSGFHLLMRRPGLKVKAVTRPESGKVYDAWGGDTGQRLQRGKADSRTACGKGACRPDKGPSPSFKTLRKRLHDAPLRVTSGSGPLVQEERGRKRR